ncbi:FecR family protein [Sphingobacterium nematocida]|uniref:FecR family protein n=1 Tax=Sphingobacterium nematocida TaxID=1513896 RepID=A0A1T5AU07_9SPHI|nr:FecR family protein [Sphingobacterium nematocida]SKB38478.1 FecR family protein [Sphingobacterium nematocida]
MDKENQLQLLLEKYAQNRLSRAEFELLLFYMDATEGDKALIEQAITVQLEQDDLIIDELYLDITLQKVDKHIQEIHTRGHHRSKKYRFLYSYMAAAIILLVGYFSFLYLFNNTLIVNRLKGQDIEPGTTQATLILSDGSTYTLNKDTKGIINDEKGIRYSEGGSIVSTLGSSRVLLQTPKGGQYRITLPDGTRAFVNAASKLYYPQQFGNTREIQLEGEAYFEVAHDAKKPFIIHSGQQELRVLGTKFNLNSYTTEKSITTLLEGRVELENRNVKQKVILKPGQQALVSKSEINVKEVMVSDYIGWTQNVFIFNDVPLTDIMEQLERWYNVETVYPERFKNTSFFAEIPRDRKLSQVLKDLEKAGDYKFEIQGRRIIVR